MIIVCHMTKLESINGQFGQRRSDTIFETSYHEPLRTKRFQELIASCLGSFDLKLNVMAVYTLVEEISVGILTLVHDWKAMSKLQKITVKGLRKKGAKRGSPLLGLYLFVANSQIVRVRHPKHQSTENHRKECHRFWLLLCQAVILISNVRTSALKKKHLMALT